jgi:hypothetical protein
MGREETSQDDETRAESVVARNGKREFEMVFVRSEKNVDEEDVESSLNPNFM